MQQLSIFTSDDLPNTNDTAQEELNSILTLDGSIADEIMYDRDTTPMIELQSSLQLNPEVSIKTPCE